MQISLNKANVGQHLDDILMQSYKFKIKKNPMVLTFFFFLDTFIF